jgi:hypothetical protein
MMRTDVAGRKRATEPIPRLADMHGAPSLPRHLILLQAGLRGGDLTADLRRYRFIDAVW